MSSFTPCSSSRRKSRAEPKAILTHTSRQTTNVYRLGSVLNSKDQTLLYKLCRMMDTTKSGAIFPNDLRRALAGSGLNLDPGLIDSVVKGCDTDKSDKIDYDRFFKTSVELYKEKKEERLSDPYLSSTLSSRKSGDSTSRDSHPGFVVISPNYSKDSAGEVLAHKDRSVSAPSAGRRSASLKERKKKELKEEPAKPPQLGVADPWCQNRAMNKAFRFAAMSPSRPSSSSTAPEQAHSSSNTSSSSTTSSSSESPLSPPSQPTPSQHPIQLPADVTPSEMDDLRLRIISSSTSSRIAISLSAADSTGNGKLTENEFFHALEAEGVHLNRDLKKVALTIAKKAQEQKQNQKKEGEQQKEEERREKTGNKAEAEEHREQKVQEEKKEVKEVKMNEEKAEVIEQPSEAKKEEKKEHSQIPQTSNEKMEEANAASSKQSDSAVSEEQSTKKAEEKQEKQEKQEKHEADEFGDGMTLNLPSSSTTAAFCKSSKKHIPLPPNEISFSPDIPSQEPSRRIPRKKQEKEILDEVRREQQERMQKEEKHSHEDRCIDYGQFLKCLQLDLPASFEAVLSSDSFVPSSPLNRTSSSITSSSSSSSPISLHPLQSSKPFITPFHRKGVSPMAELSLAQQRPYSLYARNVSVDVIAHTDASRDTPKKPIRSHSHAGPQSHGAFTSHSESGGEENEASAGKAEGKEEETSRARRLQQQLWMREGSGVKRLMMDRTPESDRDSHYPEWDEIHKGKAQVHHEQQFGEDRKALLGFTVKENKEDGKKEGGFEDTWRGRLWEGTQFVSKDGHQVMRMKGFAMGREDREKKVQQMREKELNSTPERDVKKAFVWETYDETKAKQKSPTRPVSASRMMYLKQQAGTMKRTLIDQRERHFNETPINSTADSSSFSSSSTSSDSEQPAQSTSASTSTTTSSYSSSSPSNATSQQNKYIGIVDVNERDVEDVQPRRLRSHYASPSSSSCMGDLIWGGLPKSQTPQWQRLSMKEMEAKANRTAQSREGISPLSPGLQRPRSAAASFMSQ